MSAQKGKDLLLKVDSDGAGTYVTVAGLRTRSLTFNSETVDVTDSESAGQWRELLAGAGLKHAKLAGAGIFKDAVSDALMQSLFFNGTIRAWQAVIPAFGIVQGLFQISSFDLSGKHDGEIAFNLALESAGPLTFAAAP
jgi:TP901-1 family phage major tail protein